MSVPRFTTGQEQTDAVAGMSNGGDQLLALLQFSNASFPTGAFSHSYGFETWVAEGTVMDAASAAERCRDWLRFGVATGDAVAVIAAFRDALYNDMGGIAPLDRRLGALKLARETRSASVKTGAALISACRDIFRLAMVIRLEAMVKDGACAGHYATVYGVAAADLGFTEHQAVASYLWSGLSNLVSVVARLVPLGQVDVQKIIAAAGPLIEDCAEIARTRPLERMGSLLASLDTAAVRHERLATRLCIS